MLIPIHQLHQQTIRSGFEVRRSSNHQTKLRLKIVKTRGVMIVGVGAYDVTYNCRHRALDTTIVKQTLDQAFSISEILNNGKSFEKKIEIRPWVPSGFAMLAQGCNEIRSWHVFTGFQVRLTVICSWEVQFLFSYAIAVRYNHRYISGFGCSLWILEYTYLLLSLKMIPQFQRI